MPRKEVIHPMTAKELAQRVQQMLHPEPVPQQVVIETAASNQAIFGAYLNSSWPEQKAWGESVKSAERIFQALNWIAFDITRPENAEVWPRLLTIEPARSRIQLFDSVWWMYFRKAQPVR
jgi:hypothetical protein